MLNRPAVSVCISSYNHGRFLPRCLDSILAQTEHDFEIAVVDDGSTDDSHEILLGYQARYPEKIHYSWHPGHVRRNISFTTNAAIRAARGRYIAFIGSDDTWYPEKLQCQLALLEANPQYGYVYSYAHFIDDEDNLLPGLYGVDITQDANPTGQMILSCHPPAMTVVIRRSCLDDVEWFDESLVYGDWDLMARLTARYPAGFTAQPLARYRIHGTNISKRIDPNVDLQRILTFTKALHKKSGQVGGAFTDPRNQAIFALQFSFLHFCMHEQGPARDYIWQAFDLDPTLRDDVGYLNGWLNRWKPEFFTTSHPHFGFWFVDHLPETVASALRTELMTRQTSHPDTVQFFVRRGIDYGQAGREVKTIFADLPDSAHVSGQWKAGVLRQVYPALLFEAHKQNQPAMVRKYWFAAVRQDLRCLANRGFLSVGLKSLLKPASSRS